MIPANLGVNPSLTITALAERAMSYIPAKDAATTSVAATTPAAGATTAALTDATASAATT